ncbi:crotonase/enoyl-CoA hydratase family protein [Luteimonas sp. S4-F44]|uniref:crotonase/enoyl-CoA hydratase family protein n=1 Tax=Luteimonas sp. S4-F44 TaxID=2925842 RepID=UPI001F53A6B2|nr:crotonase/enoyl-CoA hydratase family protein [Luteimonas sp. S4-F44]UNK43915.1 crotonase/enoyl-CoA hydratase family protein [Luteimonas sp. S4-F44]
MQAIESFRREGAAAPSFLRLHHDASNDAHWCFMHAQPASAQPDYRPCFSLGLLRELRLFAQASIERISERARVAPAHLSHIVLASDAPVYNLGGDLQLFLDLIRQRDREALTRYARQCVDNIHLLQTRLHPNAHTIALVQGDALGGGLELALACRTIVAERGVQMGFPEVLFGLFPGMGAYSLLAQRVSPQVAEEMMLGGTMYSSEDLHRLGLVDVLVEPGEGVPAVHEQIRKHRRIATARLALHRVRDGAHPIPLAELVRITDIWVDTALQLEARHLRTMERLVRAQQRLQPTAAGVERTAVGG